MAERARGKATWISRRRAVIPAFAGTVVAALILWALICVLEPYLASGEAPELLPAYVTWFPAAAAGNVLARVLWVIGDVTEGSFMNSVAASCGLVLFTLAGAAYTDALERVERRGRGTFVGTVMSLVFSLFSCALTTLLFGWTLEGGWAPTFVSFLLSMILISFYGPTLPHAATVAVAMAVVPCPVCELLQNGFALPLGLPPFAAVGMGMAISTALTCEVFRLLPWMRREVATPARRRRRITPSTLRADYVGAVLAGVGDMCGTSGPFAGFGMLFGLLLGWELSPAHAVYGTGTASLVLALVLGAAITVFVHFDELESTGSLYTFSGLLAIGAVTTTYDPHPLVLVCVVLLGSTVVPWLVARTVELTPLQDRWPSSVYAQVIASAATIILSCVVTGFLALVGPVVI